MDTASTEMLEKIVVKEVEALTQSDIDFLNARSSYLNDAQTEKFSSVLNGGEEKKSSKKAKSE